MFLSIATLLLQAFYVYIIISIINIFDANVDIEV